MIRAVEFIADVGPSITFNLQTLTTYLKDFQPLNEEDIMDVFIYMSNNYAFLEDSTSKIVSGLFNCVRKNSIFQFYYSRPRRLE